MLSSQQKAKKLGPGECFGNFFPITGNNWIKSFLFAETDASLIEIDCTTLSKLMEKANDNYNFKQLLSFLGNSIEGFEKVSRVKRDRIARAFKDKTYPINHYFVKEGIPQNTAYLIVKGECLLVSKKNPLVTQISYDGKISKNLNK